MNIHSMNTIAQGLLKKWVKKDGLKAWGFQKNNEMTSIPPLKESGFWHFLKRGEFWVVLYIAVVMLCTYFLPKTTHDAFGTVAIMLFGILIMLWYFFDILSKGIGSIFRLAQSKGFFKK